MPAEILVMCGACGLPQPPRPSCTRCGAALPESPVPGANAQPAPPEPPQSAAAAAPAAAVIPLSGGRRMSIGPDAVELPESGSQGPRRVELGAIRRVALERSWSAPALLVTAAGVLSAAIVPWWPLRLLSLAVAAAGAWLVVRARGYVMRVEPREGDPIRVVLGAGSRGGAQGVNAQSAWLSASDELRRRGIDVAG